MNSIADRITRERRRFLQGWAFIGLSRLLEDDHWPSDIVAGYLLGAMMLAVAIVIYHALTLLWLHRHELRARIARLRR